MGNKIMGEIYEVDDKMLGKLDELEDHPKYGLICFLMFIMT